MNADSGCTSCWKRRPIVLLERSNTRRVRARTPDALAQPAAFNPLDPRRTTVVEYRTIANPGGLVPGLAPVPATWKGYLVC